MWLVWGVTLGCTGLVAACVMALRADARGAPRAWRILAGSGVPLALGGLGFIVRFWEPLPGPYRANEVYPLGPYLNVWAVSFGFMWLAFGLVFFALALRAPRTGRTWLILLVAWALAWLPHGIIGIGFAAAGDYQPSLQLYRDWALEWPGLIQLCASALLLLAHFALSVGGFAATGRSLLHGRSRVPLAEFR